MQLARPAVSLTDFALAIECTAFVAVLMAQPASDPMLRNLFVAFFASVSIASMLGGTMHGFFEYSTRPVRGVLWAATLVAVVLAGFAEWTIGAALLGDAAVSQWIIGFALLLTVACLWTVLFVRRDFTVAIVAYVPATLFFLASLAVTYRQSPDPALAWGAAGLVLVFLGAGLQQLGVALPRIRLDHNTLYHIIQGVALWLIYLAADWLVVARLLARSAT